MRGRNNNNNSNNNRKGPNPLSRSYESNGPDVKIRGTAYHIGEKYLQLARDAQSSGDPVTAESYLQHAEHYFRIIAAAQQAQQAQYGSANSPAGEAEPEESEEEDDFSGLTDRFASPPERVAPQQQPQPYAGQPQGQNGQNGQPNYNGQSNYQERPPQAERPQSERPQYEPRGDRGNRNFQGRQDRGGQDRGGYERNNFAERGPQPNRDGNRPRQPSHRPEGQRYDNAPRYERQEPRPVSDEVENTGLPAFITAPVPVRVQPEPPLPIEEEAVGTEVLARPEAEGEAGFALRPRRRRRKPEFGGAETNKASFED
ncbi:DUF4167 domain-containing protein [Methylovirgula ligni]|nr:DUF4167 domain-containing protein [Methylovirgula ligni]